MRILIVHQNFPGQYKHIAPALARDPVNEVVALATTPRASPQGVRIIRYSIERTNSTSIHPFAGDFETKMIRGEAAARAAETLKQEGFRPDLIIGHPGWGEMLFLSDVWPEAHTLSYMEFYFQRSSPDFAFDPEFASSRPEAYWRMRAKNATFLMSIETSDWCVAPTRWQWQQLPDFAKARTSIIHDGVDTDLVRPNPEASLHLGRLPEPCRPGDEVISFVNRNLEPYRGYHIFMRALPEILARRPRARAIIVGSDGVSYGASPPAGTTWKERFLREVAPKLDMSRIHLVGQVPYRAYLSLLQVSAAHVYLTYPFVLSWSMLEAMSAGCLVIGSRTPPVTEVLEHGRNGLLVDFFSPGEIAETVVRALERPQDFAELRREARRMMVENYDLNRICLPKHLRLIEDVAQGRTPEQAA